jgi:tripartite-type tricarboxylate transporter receptor subunit TctC
MKLPRRRFLHVAAGAAALPAVSRIARRRSSRHVLYGFLFSLGVDPVADLVPLSVVGRFPNMMVIPNSSSWKSVREFIAYAKANPGKINWALPGVGHPLISPANCSSAWPALKSRATQSLEPRR